MTYEDLEWTSVKCQIYKVELFSGKTGLNEFPASMNWVNKGAPLNEMIYIKDDTDLVIQRKDPFFQQSLYMRVTTMGLHTEWRHINIEVCGTQKIN